MDRSSPQSPPAAAIHSADPHSDHGMRVAILSESPADEAAITILAESVLKRPILPFTPPLRKRPNGWPSVLNLLPVLAWFLYQRTDAEGLIVVVDADDTSLHPKAPHNRMNLLRNCLRDALQTELPQSQRPFHIAVGVAAPALEAWLLAPRLDDINENTWRSLHVPRNGRALRQHYKRLLYHTNSPNLQLSTRRMQAAVRELAPQIDTIAKRFPLGLQPLLDDLASWRTTT